MDYNLAPQVVASGNFRWSAFKNQSEAGQDEVCSWLDFAGVRHQWFFPHITHCKVQGNGEAVAARDIVEHSAPESPLWIGFHLPLDLRVWLEQSGRYWINLSKPPLPSLDWLVCVETNVPNMAGRRLIWDHCAPRIQREERKQKRCAVVLGLSPCREVAGRSTYREAIDRLFDLYATGDQVHYFSGVDKDAEAEIVARLAGIIVNAPSTLSRIFSMTVTSVASFDPFSQHLASIFDAPFIFLGKGPPPPAPLLIPVRLFRNAAFWRDILSQAAVPFESSSISCKAAA